MFSQRRDMKYSSLLQRLLYDRHITSLLMKNYGQSNGYMSVGNWDKSAFKALWKSMLGQR